MTAVHAAKDQYSNKIRDGQPQRVLEARIVVAAAAAADGATALHEQRKPQCVGRQAGAATPLALQDIRLCGRQLLRTRPGDRAPADDVVVDRGHPYDLDQAAGACASRRPTARLGAHGTRLGRQHWSWALCPLPREVMAESSTRRHQCDVRERSHASAVPVPHCWPEVWNMQHL